MRFNEAGILHPEKLLGFFPGGTDVVSFNEAGILHPEKQRGGRGGAVGFHASMRPGFYTRKSQTAD